MMTRNQVIELMKIMAAADRRTAGKSDVDAWEAFIGDLDFADAQAVIVAHYRDSTEWLKPAHVRQGVAAIRAKRLEAAGPIVPPRELEDDPEGQIAWLRAAEKAIADGRSAPQQIASGAGVRREIGGTR